MNFLQRLFSQPKVKTEPLPGASTEATKRIDGTRQGGLNHLPPGIHVGKLSNIGKVRERNEDSLFVAETLLHHNYGPEPFGLFIVADGMGGHQKGEVASSLAIRTVANHLLKDIYLPFLSQDNRSAANRPINEALIAAVEDANTLVQEQIPEGGTTLTAALVMGNNAYIAHVGDTRAYLYNQSGLKQITKDHSYVQRLVELGQETPEGALVHPQRNVLYRAIGQGGVLEVDTHVQYLPSGSALMLCSDGLWGLVKDETLKTILNNAETPQQACEQLVEEANKNGGEDNITVIIVSMGVDLK